jgi:hypothetical protein
MSARDELAKLLASEIDDDVYGCTRVWEAWIYGTMSQDDFVPINEEPTVMAELAAAILAAGYRKPRTITTEAELDALPNGSVVLSEVYTAHHGQAISFQRWEDGLWHRGARSGSTHPDNFLPVTVLYEPSGE